MGNNRNREICISYENQQKHPLLPKSLNRFKIVPFIAFSFHFNTPAISSNSRHHIPSNLFQEPTMASSNTHSDSETNPSPVHFSGGYSKSVEERVFVGESSDDVSPVVDSTRGGDDVHRSAEEARDANIGGNDEEEVYFCVKCVMCWLNETEFLLIWLAVYVNVVDLVCV